MDDEKKDMILDHLYGELDPDTEEEFLDEASNSKLLSSRLKETRQLLTAYRLSPIMEIPENIAEETLKRVTLINEEKEKSSESKACITEQSPITKIQPVIINTVEDETSIAELGKEPDSSPIISQIEDLTDSPENQLVDKNITATENPEISNIQERMANKPTSTDTEPQNASKKSIAEPSIDTQNKSRSEICSKESEVDLAQEHDTKEHDTKEHDTKEHDTEETYVTQPEPTSTDNKEIKSLAELDEKEYTVPAPRKSHGLSLISTAAIIILGFGVGLYYFNNSTEDDIREKILKSQAKEKLSLQVDPQKGVPASSPVAPNSLKGQRTTPEPPKLSANNSRKIPEINLDDFEVTSEPAIEETHEEEFPDLDILADLPEITEPDNLLPEHTVAAIAKAVTGEMSVSLDDAAAIAPTETQSVSASNRQTPTNPAPVKAENVLPKNIAVKAPADLIENTADNSHAPSKEDILTKKTSTIQKNSDFNESIPRILEKNNPESANTQLPTLAESTAIKIEAKNSVEITEQKPEPAKVIKTETLTQEIAKTISKEPEVEITASIKKTVDDIAILGEPDTSSQVNETLITPPAKLGKKDFIATKEEITQLDTKVATPLKEIINEKKTVVTPEVTSQQPVVTKDSITHTTLSPDAIIQKRPANDVTLSELDAFEVEEELLVEIEDIPPITRKKIPATKVSEKDLSPIQTSSAGNTQSEPIHTAQTKPSTIIIEEEDSVTDIAVKNTTEPIQNEISTNNNSDTTSILTHKATNSGNTVVEDEKKTDLNKAKLAKNIQTKSIVEKKEEVSTLQETALLQPRIANVEEKDDQPKVSESISPEPIIINAPVTEVAVIPEQSSDFQETTAKRPENIPTGNETEQANSVIISSPNESASTSVKTVEPVLLPLGHELFSISENKNTSQTEAKAEESIKINPEPSGKEIEFSNHDSIPELLEKSQLLYQQESYLQALFGVEDILSRSPSAQNLIEALTLKARIELKMKNYSEMEETISTLRPHSPLDATALTMLYKSNAKATKREKIKEYNAANVVLPEESLSPSEHPITESIDAYIDKKSTQPAKERKKKKSRGFKPTTDTYYKRR